MPPETVAEPLLKVLSPLKKISLTDPLTDMPNRRYAMEQLAILWEESIELDSHLSCLMIDADYFKEVNDAWGHDAGDVVLKALAKTLVTRKKLPN